MRNLLPSQRVELNCKNLSPLKNYRDFQEVLSPSKMDLRNARQFY